jgi:hypothetical protein
MRNVPTQPGKALYLAYVILNTVLVRLPFWIAISIPRPLRPRWAWSIKRSVLVRAFAYSIDISSRYVPPAYASATY